LIEILGRHPDQFPSWQPDSAALRCLTQLVEMHRRLIADKVRLIHYAMQHGVREGAG
jgi:hypothetical protein